MTVLYKYYENMPSFVDLFFVLPTVSERRRVSRRGSQSTQQSHDLLLVDAKANSVFFWLYRRYTKKDSILLWYKKKISCLNGKQNVCFFDTVFVFRFARLRKVDMWIHSWCGLTHSTHSIQLIQNSLDFKYMIWIFKNRAMCCLSWIETGNDIT